MRGRSRFSLSAVIGLCVSFLAFQALAQSFPNKPVHIVVGVAPGGGADSAARVLAQNLSQIWGQPVIVESRLGAAGATANEYVAKSAPDGYTLLVGSGDVTALSAFRGDYLPYKLLGDLVPVSLLATTPAFLVVNPSLPVHNIRELIALAKSEPGKLTYGSAGIGSLVHLKTAYFASMAGIDIVHVPYKGSSAALVGVAGGEISMDMAAPNSAKGLVKAGKLRVLAVSTPQRSPLFPTIPTISESGVPGFQYTTWYGVFGPAGIPKDVLAALSAGIAKAVSSPEVKAALLKQSAEAQADSPEAFTKFVSDDLDQSVSIAKSAGLNAK